MAEFHAVVMAGGSGTRFWPMSRAGRPKQILPLLSPRPLVRETVERLFPLFPAERILVVTGREHAGPLREALEILPPENVVEEPVGRDTAPCIGLAATLLEWRDPGSTFCSLPADHFIADVPRFHAALRRGCELAREGKLVTFGVVPTRPETGYGYLQAQGERVVRFCEKPDAERARQFLAQGGYYWNSGIFVWSSRRILDEIERHLPEPARGLGAIRDALGTSRLPVVLAQEYARMPRISIDYGVMEKAEEVAMVKADFGWDDVGSWVAVASHRAKDADGNVKEGTVVAEESKDCIVFTEEGHLVAAFGVKDLLVVHTKDATLVCPKERSSDLKKFVEALRKGGHGAVL